MKCSLFVRIDMVKKNTKQEILEVALDLFSRNGYEATSMSDISNAVGIRKASLYAHFESKQDILDSLLVYIDEKYKKHSIFSNFNFENLNDNPSFIVEEVKKQVSYIVNNSCVSKIRKLFTIEQFQNNRFVDLQQAYSYDNVMTFGIELIEHLINKKIIVNEDVDSMAAQFVLPISMWIAMCDRDPSRIDEVMNLIEKHVIQFFKIYKR